MVSYRKKGREDTMQPKLCTKCKKNIAVALPGLSEEFGYTNTELGLLGSSLYLTYGIGKFVNGVLADGSDVRKFLPTALIMTAIANLCFALSAVFITPGEVSFFGLPTNTILLWLFVFFWGASGWFQSAGFPAVAKSLTYWYSNSERGTKWSLWSCSHQVGTFLSVIVSGFLVAKFGWRMAFFVPATLAILVAIWLFNRLRDKPQSLKYTSLFSGRYPVVTVEPHSKVPPSAESSPIKILNKVVFAIPLVPTKATLSPLSNEKLIFFNIKIIYLFLKVSKYFV